MKKTLALALIVTSAFVSQAADSKVTFSLSGYYQGATTTSSNNVKGVITLSTNKVVAPFKLSSTDVLSAYGQTTKSAYLRTGVFTNDSMQVELVTSTLTNAVMIITNITQIDAAKLKIVTKETTNSTTTETTTSYVAAKVFLLSDIGGSTNKGVVSVKLTALDLQGAGKGTSSYTGKSTNSVETSTHTVHLFGSAEVVPSHKTNAAPASATGVITSGLFVVTKKAK
jgi:hypothetical protein